MKDIELIRSGQNTYDWHFISGDISTVNGVASLRNSIIHTLLLHFGELNQEIYKDKGNNIHQYAKAKDTTINRTYLQETIIATVKELEGVYDAKVTIESDGRYKAISNITIIKENGEEVVIGAV